MDKEDEAKAQIKVIQKQKIDYTDLQLIPILNDFVCAAFIVYYILLNALLFILAYFVKTDLEITN
jgi:hypothetical protein